MDIFFTVDTEIWCGGWKDIDKKFPQAFQRYVYGQTSKGEFGLRYKLKELQDHGMRGVFFVEPLFATRFGLAPLAEIIGLIREHDQEVQMHLHPEWVDESLEPLIENYSGKRQFIRDFSLAEQTTLIGEGIKLIEKANGGRVNAFRAGSFGFNADTLKALAANKITFDSSYNASIFGLDSGILPGTTVVEPVECHGVFEYPMTVFNDGTSALRHVQLGACSFREMEGLLWQALELKRSSFVILSHNFELLNVARDRPDELMVKRFKKLCEFFANNKDTFQVRGFQDLQARATTSQPAPLSSPLWRTGHRMLEQITRRRYG